MKLGIEELSIIVEGLRLRVKQLSSSVTEINQSIENLETEDGTKAPAIMQTTSPAAIASFSDGGEDMPIKSLKCTIVPVQAGTGDPAPDNVRPITGWNGVTVVRTGKNLWSLGSSGRADTAGFLFEKQSLPYFLKPAAYTVSFDGTISNAVQLTLRDINDNIVYTKVIRTSDVVDGHCSFTFTLDNTAIIASIYSNGTSSVNNFMLEIGSTESVYEPYQTAYTQSAHFPQPVYGGWVDVIKGEVHVTHGIVDLGSLTWLMNSGENQRFTAVGLRGIIKPAASSNDTINAICSQYKIATPNQLYLHTYDYAIGCDTTGTILLWDSRYAEDTSAELKEALSGIQLVYELDTETIISIDPLIITTLLGNNNVYCDTGTTEVEYAADTKIYIDNAVAAVTPEPEPEPSPEQDDTPPEEEEEEEAEPAPEVEEEEAAEEEEAVPVVKKSTRKK